MSPWQFFYNGEADRKNGCIPKLPLTFLKAGVGEDTDHGGLPGLVPHQPATIWSAPDKNFTDI